MNTQTNNRGAFEDVTRALGEIDEYNVNKKVEHLERAETALALARQEDGDYLDAIFYSGMVSDLIGRPADATPYFERILQEIEKDDVQLEARFNLAVSYYHRYSHRFLKLAEEHFLKVIEETKDTTLRNLARAHLAQTYAMWSRPGSSQRDDLKFGEEKRAAVYEHIKKMFDKSLEYVALVRREIPRKRRFEASESHLWKKIAATADNASGMTHMYLFDYPVPTKEDDGVLLEKAVKNLEAADAKLPFDWANTSDLGSVHLRLGVLKRAKNEKPDTEFQKAKTYLEKVVTTLRPNYGFALHELGRLHRLWEQWERAIEYFDRSLAVPERYRDISSSAVEQEKLRAFSKDSQYP